MLIDENTIRPLIWNGILPSLFLISYVVNIGFSRAWKKWPAVVSAAAMLIAAGIGFLRSGVLQTLTLAQSILVFAQLGICFLLAVLLAMPGCEMRSIHHLFSIVTGRPTAEHHFLLDT